MFPLTLPSLVERMLNGNPLTGRPSPRLLVVLSRLSCVPVLLPSVFFVSPSFVFVNTDHLSNHLLQDSDLVTNGGKYTYRHDSSNKSQSRVFTFEVFFEMYRLYYPEILQPIYVQ